MHDLLLRLTSQILILTALSTVSCLAQSSAPIKPREARPVVSIDELAMPPKARSEFNKGVNLLLSGNAQACIEHFLRTIQQSPRYFGAYHNLALAYLRLGQTDAAAQNFQKVIELTDSHFAPSLYGLAMILYRNNELTASESLLRRALTIERTPAGAYCLATVLFSLGRITDAEGAARDAIQLDPAASDSYLLLARIHEAQNEPSATIDDLGTFFRLTPNNNLKSEALAILYRAQQAQSASASLH